MSLDSCCRWVPRERENHEQVSRNSSRTSTCTFFIVTMSFFDQFKGDSKKKKNENPLKNVKNPFAQVGKAMSGKNRKFGGDGQSLGGSHPGRLIHIRIEQEGPVGVKVSVYLPIIL